MFSADTIEFLFYMGFEDFDAQTQEFFLDEDEVVDVLAQIEMFEMGGHPDQEGLSREIGYDAIDDIRDELEDWVYENRKVHHRGGVSKAIDSIGDVQIIVNRQLTRVQTLDAAEWLQSNYSDVDDEEIEIYVDFTEAVLDALHNIALDDWPEYVDAVGLNEEFIRDIPHVDDISENYPALQALDVVMNAIDGLEQLERHMDTFGDDEDY